jgi:hypothetical protein
MEQSVKNAHIRQLPTDRLHAWFVFNRVWYVALRNVLTALLTETALNAKGIIIKIQLNAVLVPLTKGTLRPQSQ